MYIIESNPIIKAKDLAIILNVSLRTAQRLYQDIKTQYQIKNVTLKHYNDYFKIP